MEEGFEGRGQRSGLERLALGSDHQVGADLVGGARGTPWPLARSRRQIDEILVWVLGENEEQGALTRVPRHAAGEGVPEQRRRSRVFEQRQMTLAFPDGQTIRAGEPFGQDRPQVAIDLRKALRQRREVGLREDDRLEVCSRANRRHRGLPREERDLAHGPAGDYAPDEAVDSVLARDDDVGASGLRDEDLLRAVALGDDRRPCRVRPGLQALEDAGQLLRR